MNPLMMILYLDAQKADLERQARSRRSAAAHLPRTRRARRRP
jgi:hypothetical protein